MNTDPPTQVQTHRDSWWLEGAMDALICPPRDHFKRAVAKSLHTSCPPSSAMQSPSPPPPPPHPRPRPAPVRNSKSARA